MATCTDPTPPNVIPTSEEKVLSIWDLHGLLTLLTSVATKWRFIGLGLCFSDPQLETIAHKLTNVVGGPLECFRDMLSQWLRGGPPDHDRPTVSTLATALRAPTVMEKRLANELQQSFIPSGSVISLLPPLGVEVVKSRIELFKQRFDSMKKAALKELEARKVNVRDLRNNLTSLRGLKREKDIVIFLTSRMNELCNSSSVEAVFCHLNLYWGYLNFHLLDHIIKRFALNELQKEMNEYKAELEEFKNQTPLETFGKAHEEDDPVIPDEFEQLVSHHQFPKSATLKEVEKVCVALKKEYSLEDCALMLYKVLCGSIIIVWLVPKSLTEHILLMASATKKGIFRENMMSRLDLHGKTIYEDNLTSASALVPVPILHEEGLSSQPSSSSSLVGLDTLPTRCELGELPAMLLKEGFKSIRVYYAVSDKVSRGNEASDEVVVGSVYKDAEKVYRVILHEADTEKCGRLLSSLHQVDFTIIRVYHDKVHKAMPPTYGPLDLVAIGFVQREKEHEISVFLNKIDIWRCLQFVSPLYQLESSTVRLQRTEQSLADGDWVVTEILLIGEELQPHGAHALADVLSLTTGLHTLFLSGNRIGVRGAQHLADGLKSSNTLQELYLYGNSIGDEGMKHLATSLKSCTSLIELDLGWNALTDGCVQDITELIMSLKSLSNLWLGGNQFSGHGEWSLQEAEEKRSKLANYSKLNLTL